MSAEEDPQGGASEEARPEADAKPEADAPDPGRRKLLALATAGLGACVGLGVAGAVGGAVVGTPLGDEGGGERWIDLGPLSRFPEGEPVKVPAIGQRRDAWSDYAARPLGSVVVVREGASARAFSSICPHNGCAVFVGEAELVCPCHDSRFALDGSLTAGESPRGLDPLEVRVEDEQLAVRFQRFVVGIEERKPV